MSALPRPAAVAALALAAGLLLAGCASAGDPSAAPEPATSSGLASEPPSVETGDDDESGEDADGDPGAAPAGAYVDYRDGIIAETAGMKALFFHAPWCPQCRALEQSILEGEIPDGLTIIKTDFDSETALRQQYGVTLQTTIVYVDDDGEALGSAVLYDDTSLDALVAAAP